jgi:hypothetical protein
MIPNPHSRRFDPRSLSKAITSDWEELLEALDAELGSAAMKSTIEPSLLDFDEALEQIVSEGCKLCPLCWANVDRDGTVVNREPFHPNLAAILKGKDGAPSALP